MECINLSKTKNINADNGKKATKFVDIKFNSGKEEE